MPPLVQAGVPVGTVTSDAVSPLLRGAVLVLAGHDHQASALGARAAGAGDELDSSGTAEALVRTVPRVPSRADVGRLAAAGITTDPSIRPGHWSLLGGTEGGLAQNRVLELLGVGPDELAALDAAAEHAPDGRVVVGGLGSDALTLGGIAGGVGPGELWKAVVAAAADQALDLHRAMDGVVGPATRVVVTGGWRHSREVMRAKTTRFDHLEVSAVEEAGALGAAVLAARATGAIGPDDHLAAR
jgi:sugar (pentulose or hexulose) kinase